MSVPLLYPLIAFIVGIILADYGMGLIVGSILISVSILIYLLLLKVSSNPMRAYRVNPMHRSWILLMCIGTGIVCCDINKPEVVEVESSAAVCGKVESRSSTVYGDRMIINVATLRIDDIVSHPHLKLQVYLPPVTYSVGDMLELAGTLKPLRESPDRLPSGYVQWLIHKGIGGSLQIQDESMVICKEKGSGLEVWAHEVHDRLDIFISHTELSPNTKAFIKALTIGEREEVKESHRQAFADAGVAHLLALSGLHVGIILMIILWLSYPFSLTGYRNLRYLLALPLLWGYVLVTGCSPTIIRAAVMATCGLVGLMLERKRSGINSLCAAIFILLIINPFNVFNVGLQLSAACVAGILIFTERLNPFRHRESPRLYKMASIVLTTLVATLFTWPITAFYFRNFPTLFLPINFIVLPLLPLYVGAVLIYLILAAIGFEMSFLRNILDIGYESFHRLASYLGEGSSISVHISGITLFIWLGATLILAFGIIRKTKHSRQIIISAVCLMLLSVATIPLFRPFEPEGFIIGRPSGNFLITSYSEGYESQKLFPRRKNSFFTLNGKRLAIIDDEIDDTIINGEENSHILLVGGNFKGTLNDLVQRFKPELILIHPSVYPAKEKVLRSELTLKVPVYSLRHDGAYHYFSK